MASNKRFDDVLGKWLDESAPARLSERVLDATFQRTRTTRQHAGWRGLLERFRMSQIALAAGTAGVILVVVGLAAGLAVNRPGIGGGGLPASPPSSAAPASPTGEPTPAPSPTPEPTPVPSPTPDPTQPFLGVWISTSDPDGGTQTMTVTENAGNGVVAIVVLDTIASVCNGTSSTMTGAASVDGTRLVVRAPDYRCDDGGEPHLINGDPTPLNEILRNLTYVLNSERDILTVGDGVWTHQPADAPSPTPPATTNDVFLGSWEATDNPPDSSHLTMEVAATLDGGFDIEIHDDSAAVCQGTPSTMTGVAFETAPGTYVIAQPDYRCDDGTEAHELSGPPLAEQLRNYTFVYNPNRDRLREPGGVVWSRVVTAQ